MMDCSWDSSDDENQMAIDLDAKQEDQKNATTKSEGTFCKIFRLEPKV